MDFELNQKFCSFATVNFNETERLRLRNISAGLSELNYEKAELINIFSPIIKEMKNSYRAIVLRPEKLENSFFSYRELHDLYPKIADLFGELIIQNSEGNRIISVYDRDRLGSMEKGARYHQTREGGTIHTDNVSIPEKWDYLFMGCISPALVGGENILVDGVEIHQELKKNFPSALKVLEEDFIWEMRGVGENLYKAPIISYNEKGEPLFRHLRLYMESAHQKAGKPLTMEQLFAIDVLDSLTNSSNFQHRFKMSKGDILLTKDSQVLHGRACFSDAIESVNFDDFYLGKGKILKRTMERMWIKCS